MACLFSVCFCELDYTLSFFAFKKGYMSLRTVCTDRKPPLKGGGDRRTAVEGVAVPTAEDFARCGVRECCRCARRAHKRVDNLRFSTLL